MPASGLGSCCEAPSSRSFDFANLASEGIASVEVYKSGRASLPTGGIGSTINIRTPRPLDRPGLQGSIGVKGVLDQGERLMGFGHRVYRAEDPRARVLRRTARELDAPRYEVAEALEKAALAELRARRPDRVLETNVEFWAAIVLDYADVPANMFTSMFTCARTGGWSAHILEQKKTGRLIRPSAIYSGPSARKADEVEGWRAEWAQ